LNISSAPFSIAAPAPAKKRRMQAASSGSSDGPSLVTSGGADTNAYKDTGLPSITKLVEEKSAKLFSIMTTLALALLFIIN